MACLTNLLCSQRSPWGYHRVRRSSEQGSDTSVSVLGLGMSRGQLKPDVLRLAFLLGLCSAIGVYLILTTSVITKDGTFYIEQARQIARDPAGVCRRYPPGYPFLLWVSHAVAASFAEGDSPMLWTYSAQAVTLLCRVLTLIPLYLLGKRLVGPVNSFWALFVLVILPYPAFYANDVLREWPYLLFLSTGLFLLYRGLATRRWWTLSLVGLDAGLGYLIRPECAQLIVYAILGLVVTHKSLRTADRPLSLTRPLNAGLLTILGFIAPIVPYVQASGSIVPHQFRPPSANMPPVLSAIGLRAASDAPLEFEVRAGELLELPIQATDPDGDRLAYSLAGAPTGSSPVYQFRSTAVGAEFWTLSEQEKERLATIYYEAWDCEGIAWYAYARPDARPGLQPVHRFWSPTQERHFYTMSESEKETILAESTPESWAYEGVVFYALGEGDPPADAAAVYRLWDQTHGYSWTMTPPAQGDIRKDAIAWYAHPAQDAPAGARIENGVFRWRPRPEQIGEHQMNIIVTDGKLPCCQSVIVRVTGPGAVGQSTQVSRPCGVPTFAGMSTPDGHMFLSVIQRIPFRKLARAGNELAGGISDDFMIIPVLPWILGLYVQLKSRAGRLERVLILAILVVGAGLVIGRGVWLAPGSARRYCIPLIAMTIFYLPAGLDVVTRALNRICTFRGRLAAFGAERRSLWFYLLMLVAIALCTPKLIYTPLRGDKAGLRAAGQWLREHTPAASVIADPDRRVCFYADRPGLLYERYPNWKRADYVVVIEEDGGMQTPEGWGQAYSVPVDSRHHGDVTIYSKTPAKK
jgi:hypothetical protein